MNKLILVHGVYYQKDAGETDGVRARREDAFATYGRELGVRDYEWVSGRSKVLANRLLRMARGTAPAVDAIEIIELEEDAMQASLASKSRLWRSVAAGTPYGLDAARSFILLGSPRKLLEGTKKGQRILWFGRGLSPLSESEFIAHYTGHHGPLVAQHAHHLGIRHYRQIPNEHTATSDSLRQLGMGRASPPAVFAELWVGTPPLTLSSLGEASTASREIAVDEKRHIDFGHSMLLLA
jgi:EthD domain